MKVVRIALVGIAALSILAPGANAQRKSATFSFVQKFQPVVRSYPGVAADMLGIRTGMTVPQAEAIAEKNYPGKPVEDKTPDTYTYKEVTAQSHPFIRRLDFTKQTTHTSDTLSLYFSSPVTGNTLLGMSRRIVFYKNPEQDPNSALNAPLVSTLKASLIKKYGPASYQGTNGGVDQPSTVIAWIFTKESRVTCTEFCGSDGPGTQQNDLTGLDPAPEGPPGANPSYWGLLNAHCGVTVIGHPFVFTIAAQISANGYDKTKATDMTVSMGDTATCMADGKEAVKQLKSDAIKFYNSVSKAPAAPKF